jgi:hypothetical protein
MRVQVTLENILAYGLDTLTGNTREDLLARAAQEEAEGNNMYVIIPDVAGGDTEAPTERNIFAHFSEMPDPDGRSHDQVAVDLSQACSYKLDWHEDGNSFFVCKKHNAVSKHSIDALSRAPCLAIDPYPYTEA